MTRPEMVAAVARLCNAEGTEREMHDLLTQLNRALPYAGICDMIFHERHDLGPEDLVDEALRRERTVRASGLWNMPPPEAAGY